jgi:hypothetical protein
MKLYTEEQVRKMLFDLGDVLFNNNQNGIKEGEPEEYFNGIIEEYTLIKLPSDEDIKGYIKSIPYYGHCTSEYCEGIEDGIKWTLDKIQGGNK